jgi:transcriptional regulator with XRE-family HTH domain
LVEPISFGEKLKQAREERGLPLEAVASATRIARHHLDALERGDLRSIPSGPFGKSYIRAYADFLGIDPQPILEAYRSNERDGGGPAPSEREMVAELARLIEERKRRRERASPSSLRTAIAVGLPAIALAAAAVWWLRVDQPEGRGVPVPVSSRVAARPVPEDVGSAQAPPLPPPEATPGGLLITDSGVGTAVVDHILVGQGEVFPEGSRVVFWTRVVGGKPGDRIHHVWSRDGRVVMNAPLRVGGDHWRTHSRFTLPAASAGTWSVEARAGDGRVLARAEFLCAP